LRGRLRLGGSQKPSEKTKLIFHEPIFIRKGAQSMDKASSIPIKVLLVVDAEYIKKHYPKKSNPDWKNPVGVDHNSYFLFADDPRGIISGQGTADLNFRAMVGDSVQLTGVSFDDNNEDAVIVYGTRKRSGDDLFTQFTMQMIRRERAVSPDPNSPNFNGLPPLHVPKDFGYLYSKVTRMGKELLDIEFGLYTLDDDGQTQSLYGYFFGDASITVS
jgi:nematocidal protein AidA